MSLARRHRERIAAQLAAASSLAGQIMPPVATAVAGGEPLSLPTGGHPTPPSTAAAQIMMRFTGDSRRLKQIQSVQAKIAAKREMLPEYAAWCEGLVKAAEDRGVAVADEILPTIMVWRIDTGDYTGALKLAAHVLRHKLPMPARYNRTAATLIVEEIAEAALRDLGKGQSFSLDILNATDDLTADEDIFDEVRAKLAKAIGMEFHRRSGIIDAAGDHAEAAVLRTTARAAFARARDLHERCGVTKLIERLDRAISKDAGPAG